MVKDLPLLINDDYKKIVGRATYRYDGNEFMSITLNFEDKQALDLIAGKTILVNLVEVNDEVVAVNVVFHD